MTDRREPLCEPKRQAEAPSSGVPKLPLRRRLYLRYRNRILRPVCRRTYRDPGGDIDRSIFIAGAARSGTTWLADTLGSIAPCRTMFEPFHPERAPGFPDLRAFYYMRPAEPDEELQSYCDAVLSGRIRNAWIDRQVSCIFPRFRVIKEINANFFLRWIRERYRALPILFVIRHPCAVVLSRLRSGWPTDSDIAGLLAQEKLVDDHLREHLSLIRAVRTEEEKHAIVWCANNLVPLAQFEPGELDVFFYEDLCRNPETAITRILQTLGHGPVGDGSARRERALRRIVVPSATSTRSSAVMAGGSRVSQWREELSPDQISNILSVVETFGLGHLYEDSVLPRAGI